MPVSCSAFKGPCRSYYQNFMISWNSFRAEKVLFCNGLVQYIFFR